MAKISIYTSIFITFYCLSNIAFANKFYDVINIDSDDTLTVRSGPGVDHKKLSTLPYDAKYVLADKALKPSDDWIPVVASDTRGWVNRKYLKPSTLSTFNQLTCFGNEPSWSLSLKDSVIKYKDIDSEIDDEKQSFALTGINPSVNHTNRWFLTGNTSSEQLHISLHRSQSCSDDMSDKLHTYDLMLIDQNQRVMTGCCR